MRTAISEWHAKTLRRAQNDIGTKIAGRLEKRQRRSEAMMARPPASWMAVIAGLISRTAPLLPG